MKVRALLLSFACMALVACGNHVSGSPDGGVAAPSGLIYSTNPAVYTIGESITSNTPSNSGGAVASYAITPALPEGLGIATTTGAISGTPRAVSPATAYTVTASNSGGSTTATLTIAVKENFGPKANAIFTVQPSNVAAGAAISPAVTVTLVDAQGRTITSDSATTVTLAIGTNPASGTLMGTLAQTAVNGVATFSDLNIDKAGSGYTVTVAASGYTGVTSGMFNVAPGTMAKAVFTAQPSNVAAGVAISPVAVTLEDAFGNTTTTDSTTTVTLAIGTNPGSGTLSGTLTQTAASGVARFSDLSIDQAGSGYTLTASASGYSGATSTGFNVSPGAMAKAVFTVEPSAVNAGTPIFPAVAVTLEDALGNTITTDSTTTVTLAIGTNPGSGTLSGTLTQTAASGAARFSDLSIDQPGSGYTLTVSASGYSSATSTGFNVAPAPRANAVFSVQPAGVTAGQPIPAMTVMLLDTLGHRVSSDSTTMVTLSLGTNANGGTLSGTAIQTASTGIVVFSGLSIDKAGSYTLVAAASGYNTATSNAFAIVPGAKANAVFTVQPSSVAAGMPISPAVKVTLADALGNTVSSDSTTMVTLSIRTNPAGGTLSGTLAQTASNGVATFSGLSIDKAGSGYQLSATATGCAGAVSSLFDVSPGPKAAAVFTVQPSSATAGVAIGPAVTVTLEDALGNTITTDSTTTVTLAIGNNPGSGTLSGATSKTASQGAAVFSNLGIDRTGFGYTLTAAAAGYAGATSSGFIVLPLNAKAVFAVQPSTTAASAVIAPAVTVTLEDSAGHTIATDSSTTVTLALGANPGGGTLSGTTTATASGGVATFSDLGIANAGTGYTLTAAASGYTGATSGLFDIFVPVPAITGFAPAAGGVGTSVTITGTGLANATSVTFGGGPNAMLTANTATLVTAIVPSGSASGSVSVTTAGGTVSEAGFTFVPELALLAGGIGGQGTANGTGINARFYSPTGVAVDSSGNVYVADQSNNTIRKVTPTASVTTLAGSPGQPGSHDGTGSGARFTYPTGVAVDSSGNVYVADRGNHTIRKVTPTGDVTTLAGSPGQYGSQDGTGSGARFYYPTGVAVDSSGNVYVADQQNHTIRKVTQAGVVTTFAGIAGLAGSDDGMPGTFNDPSGIAVDASGTLYVADQQNQTIRLVTPAGVVTTLAGAAGTNRFQDGTGSSAWFNGPTGVAVDSSGNVYVADRDNYRIREVTPLGVVTTLAGNGGYGSADGPGSAAEFFQPTGVAVDSSGDVYVADSVNNTIRKVTQAHVVTTFAGHAPPSALLTSTDGTGSAASFIQPWGIAADASGNVYVADNSAEVIRKVTLDGVVTTLAGSPQHQGNQDGTGSSARFYYPIGVAVDSSDNVYVADSQNRTIRKVTQGGVVTTLAGSRGQTGNQNGTGTAALFGLPWGVAVDSSGNIYVGDYSNAAIRKVTQGGVVTTLATGLNAPTGVAVDALDNVYVADGYVIRKVTPAGTVTTLAGSGNPGSADGTGVAATFNGLNALAMDSSGNLFVADQGGTIRKVTPGGVVTTVVGRAGMLGVVPGPLPSTFDVSYGVAVLPSGDLVMTAERAVLRTFW
jgi:hypothetical protein